MKLKAKTFYNLEDCTQFMRDHFDRMIRFDMEFLSNGERRMFTVVCEVE